MIKTTTWKPSSCACVLHYEWDSSVEASGVVHTPVEITVNNLETVRCDRHKHILDINALHEAVITDNRKFNSVSQAQKE